MTRFELSCKPDSAISTLPGDGLKSNVFSDEILFRNASVFIWARWLVVIVCVILSGLDYYGILRKAELVLSEQCLLYLAMALVMANLVLSYQLRLIRGHGLKGMAAHIWAQIVVDLVAIIIFVNQVGSTDSAAPFLFVLHIGLSCVFFPPKMSFSVLGLSVILYLGCVYLEINDIISASSVFVKSPFAAKVPLQKLIHAVSIVLLWFSIWGLMAYLSISIRRNVRELVRTQEQMLDIYKSGQRQLVHISHQMKSPLDAIRSFITLLLEGYMGELSLQVRDALKRIDARSAALGDYISDVLRLARMKSIELEEKTVESTNLKSVISECLHVMTGNAVNRKIELDANLLDCQVKINYDPLKMMVDNLISNAINYSHDGGHVGIKCQVLTNQSIELIIEDSGIGIPAEKISKIFDEHYRTNEAKQHNAHSTGIGLAIVKQIALEYELKLAVESKVGKGTKFIIVFPGHEIKSKA